MQSYTLLNHSVRDFRLSLLVPDGVYLRSLGIEAAKRALRTYRSARYRDQPDIRVQAARVHYTMADLLKAGEASKEQLEEAITHLDAALAEPNLPPELVEHIRVSRATATIQHAEMTESLGVDTQEIRLAYKDLDTFIESVDWTRSSGDNWRILLLQAHLLQAKGQLDKARQAFQAAASVVGERVASVPDEKTLLRFGEMFVEVFDELATVYAQQAKATRALSAVEVV